MESLSLELYQLLYHLYHSRYLCSRDFHFERCVRVKGNSCGERAGGKSMLWDKGSGTSLLLTWNIDKWTKDIIVFCCCRLCALPFLCKRWNSTWKWTWRPWKAVINAFYRAQNNPAFSNLPVVGNKFGDMPEWQINQPGWTETSSKFLVEAWSARGVFFFLASMCNDLRFSDWTLFLRLGVVSIYTH